MKAYYQTVILFTITFLLALPLNAHAGNLPDSFADLVEELSPAVVNISTVKKISRDNNMRQFKQFQFQFPPGSPFEQFKEFFDQLDPESSPLPQEDSDKFSEEPQNEEEYAEEAQSLGSGFIISKDGYIVTNNHVIAEADEITINLSDDTKATAEVIGTDKKTDLALLKIEVNRNLPYVEFGDSDDARVGDWVIAIGNPFGLGGSVSAGIISARARDINAGPFDDFIQTDAAINKGNSGGPLFDTDGNVIGINTAIFSPSGGNVGIGFAMPSALAEPVIKQLRTNGRVQRGWLGVKIQTVTEEIAEGLGLRKASGALVAEVTPNSPAAEAGIQVGDVILSFNGKDIATMRKLPRIVADTDIGKTVKSHVWRNGKKETLNVKVGEFKEDEQQKIAEKPKKEPQNTIQSEKHLGMKLATVNEELAKKFKLNTINEGVIVISVDRGSDAASKGIRRGDVIISANQQSLDSVKDLHKIIDRAKDKKRSSILLLMNRNGESIFITVKL